MDSQVGNTWDTQIWRNKRCLHLEQFVVWMLVLFHGVSVLLFILLLGICSMSKSKMLSPQPTSTWRKYPGARYTSVMMLLSDLSQVTFLSFLQKYLENEKRYNYTTPKTFLEQINLYRKLFTEKTEDLKGRISRLVNGLEKLKTTAIQVDELKVVLAAQEIELHEKSIAADKLIQV